MMHLFISRRCNAKLLLFFVLSPSLPLSLSPSHLRALSLTLKRKKTHLLCVCTFGFVLYFFFSARITKHVYNSQSRSIYTRILTHATQYAIHEHLCLAVGGLWLSFVAGPGSDESHTPLCSLYETSSMHCTGCCSWWLCVARHNPWQRVTSHELTTSAH